MKTIRVAAAIILHEGTVFATQRGYGKWKDWWEFPGGKIEENETPQEALVREIRKSWIRKLRWEICLTPWNMIIRIFTCP